jgi:hypothetical protein
MNSLVIILTGKPAWADRLAAVAAACGASLRQCSMREDYIAQLVEDHVALIVVDGADADWQFWTSAPKASPATRRIPIVVVSDDPAIRDRALASGAEFAIASYTVEERLPGIFSEHGRYADAAYQSEMVDQCSQPLPPEAMQAIEKFNRGEYYKQHDLFEALWMQETGPVRDLYRAILQIGIAYFQVTRGNRRGALKMVLRSIQWFHVLPDVCQGVDVAALRADAFHLRDALTTWPEDRPFTEFDHSLLGQVHLVDGG